MKKTLALMAGCALCVSAATAAVQGNNTAVIISKTPAVTTASYQFLCVPVRGFDITGRAGNDFVALGSFLPASTLSEGTTLILPGEGNTQTIYTVSSNGKWVKANSMAGTEALTDETEPQVEVGSMLWLQLPASTSPSTIYFVGEKGRTLAEGKKLIPSPAAGMVAYGNDTDTPVPLSQVAEAQDGDQIQCIENGGTTYKVYAYVYNAQAGGGKWLDWSIPAFVEDDSVKIAPGEAFYYYRAASAE